MNRHISVEEMPAIGRKCAVRVGHGSLFHCMVVVLKMVVNRKNTRRSVVISLFIVTFALIFTHYYLFI